MHLYAKKSALCSVIFATFVFAASAQAQSYDKNIVQTQLKNGRILHGRPVESTGSGGQSSGDNNGDKDYVNTLWGKVNKPNFPDPDAICAVLDAKITPDKNKSIDFFDSNPNNSSPDTQRIQSAINSCRSGQAVMLTHGSNNASGFLTGALNLKSGVTLWIDKGVTLYASRNPEDYKSKLGPCGVDSNQRDPLFCTPLITASHTSGSAIMGDGVIDGRGGSLLTNGANKNTYSWWDLSLEAKKSGKFQHNPRLLEVDDSSNFTIYKTAFINAPQFTVVIERSNQIVAWNTKILTPTLEYSVANYQCPENSSNNGEKHIKCYTPTTVKNTDGFDPINSSKVLLTDSYISTGDDHVSVKSNGKGPESTLLSFLNNHFYFGHGISIGSETQGGVDGLEVNQLSIEQNSGMWDNGLRIKTSSSNGGEVQNISYDHVCMHNVISPIVLDTNYDNTKGKYVPWIKNVSYNYIHSYTDSDQALPKITLNASGSKPVDASLNNVIFESRQPNIDNIDNINLTFGPGPVSFSSSVTANSKKNITTKVLPVSSDTPKDAENCENAFVKFPVFFGENPI